MVRLGDVPTVGNDFYRFRLIYRRTPSSDCILILVRLFIYIFFQNIFLNFSIYFSTVKMVHLSKSLLIIASVLTQSMAAPIHGNTTRLHDGNDETYTPLVARYSGYKNAVYFTNWWV